MIRFEGDGQPLRRCQACGQSLIQGLRERASTFAKRKYCNRDCFFKHQNDQWHEEIKRRRKPRST